MNFSFISNNVFAGVLGLTLALGHAAVLAQAQPGMYSSLTSVSAPSANAFDDGLPKKKAQLLRNMDGSPAGDAALGISPDPDVALPNANQIKKLPHTKHKLSRGTVERKEFSSRPQPLITTLR